MIYTYQRRKELNEATISRLEIDKVGVETGIPYLYTSRLPERAERVGSIADLLYKIPKKAKPWDNVVPVFLEVQENEHITYQVNYVNCSPESISIATERIKNRAMWVIPDFTLKRGRDF